MLDSQSDSSFIIDQTLNSFAVATEETVINLSTMNATLPIAKPKVSKFKAMVASRTLPCRRSILVLNFQVIDHTFPQQISAISLIILSPSLASFSLSKTSKLVFFWDTMSATSTNRKKSSLQRSNPTLMLFETSWLVCHRIKWTHLLFKSNLL